MGPLPHQEVGPSGSVAWIGAAWIGRDDGAARGTADRLRRLHQAASDPTGPLVWGGSRHALP